MGEVLKVFISATTADLGAVRSAAKHALLTLGYFPIEQGHFGPAPETILEMLRRRIEESDAVLHIVGECYGAEPPRSSEGLRRSFTQFLRLIFRRTTRSYTQLEYDYALQRRKPLYIFVCGDEFPYTPHAEESPAAREFQRAHRAAVLSDSHKYERIPDLATLDTRIREIQFAAQRLGTDLRRTRQRGLLIGGAIAAGLCTLAILFVLLNHDTRQLRQDNHQQTEQSAALKQQVSVLSNDLARYRRAAESLAARYNMIAQPGQTLTEQEKYDRALTQVAEQEKLTVPELRAQLTLFVEMVRTDPAATDYDRALADFADKKFASAEANATKSVAGFRAAREAATQAKQAATQREGEAREGEIKALVLAGDAQFAQLKWTAAEDTYRAAVREGGTRAVPRNALASLLYQRGIVIDPAEGNRKLREAADLCRGTLAANPREADPKRWADTQSYLGLVLSDQATRAAGAESQRLLGEAVTAFRAALEIYTREQWPQNWAGTQNSLGTALLDQGTRAEGAQSLSLLGEAVVAFRAALEVFTREQSRQYWATAQNNLGAALWDQGRRAAGAESQRLLGEAVTAHRAALEVYTREQMPQDWALTQNNLGTALSDQGMRAAGAESLRLLGEAVTAFRATLEVYTREQLPQDWAMTQYNLGSAFCAQGARAEGAESLRLLGEAVTALRAALEVYTREQLPQDWARTQCNLGNALQLQGRRANGAEGLRLLGEAVAAYRVSLEVYTREHLPRDWRDTQENLAIVLRALSVRAEGAEAARWRAEKEAIDKELAAP